MASAVCAEPPAARPGPPIPPLRQSGPLAQVAAPPATSSPAAAGPGILRVAAQRGEVLIDKGGNGAATTEPLTAAAVLQKLDEITTSHGSVELATESGVRLRLSADGLVALLSPSSLYLARGELHILYHSSSATSASPATLAPASSDSAAPQFVVATPCGRLTIKAGDAWIRVDGNAAVTSVFAGSVTLSGNPAPGTVVQSGQSARCVKGTPLQAARPLLPAPVFLADSDLILVGDGGSPTEVTLRWQGVEAAQRYRLELFRSEGEAEVPVSGADALPARPQVELRELDPGSYVARVHALDENGARGRDSQPRRFLLARVGGLGMDGKIHADAGVMPRLNVPKGMTFSVLLDGVPPSAEALSPGAHKLRVSIGGLSAELPLLIAGKVGEAKPVEFQGDSTSVWIGPLADSQNQSQDTPPEPPAPPPSASEQASGTADAALPAKEQPQGGIVRAAEPPGPQDILLGGVGEIPFDGIFSPWSGSYIGGRVESTLSGSLRIVANGRLILRNGFGFDISANIVRAAITNAPAGEDTVDFGNLHAGLRTPALRRRHIVLQGIVGAVAALSPSFLDRSIEQDPQFVNTSGGATVLRADVLPRGGGWRVEPALLFGVHWGSFWLSTMQGVSLRVAPDFGASYAGGVLLQTEIIPELRFLSFASWQVNYLGMVINPGDTAPDVGGAVGGGFEAMIPTGSHGHFRMALLGRLGLGDAGAAIYGRAALGIQLGYLF